MENIFTKIGYALSSLRKNSNQTVLEILYIKNTDGSARWIWNSNGKKPLFLKFYNVGSFKSWLFATGIKIIFALRLQKIIFSKKTFYATALENPILNLKEDWALFTGTIGPNNKAILYANQSFYKIASTANAQELIVWEHSVLEKINSIKKRL